MLLNLHMILRTVIPIPFYIKTNDQPISWHRGSLTKVRYQEFIAKNIFYFKDIVKAYWKEEADDGYAIVPYNRSSRWRQIFKFTVQIQIATREVEVS